MNRNDFAFIAGSSAMMKARAAAGGTAMPGGNVKGFKPESKPESPQMQVFQQRLKNVSDITTVGDTFAGISPHSLALAQVSTLIAELPTDDEQVQAMDHILTEAYQLPPGQNTRVISHVIQGLLQPEQTIVRERALSRVGRSILRAVLRSSYETTSGVVPVGKDSFLNDMLKAHIMALTERPIFDFAPGTYALLEEVGLAEPLSDDQYYRNWDDTPECLAHWLRGEINAIQDRQIEPDDYALLLDHAITLPDNILGGTLTRIIDTFDNGLHLAGNEMVAMEVLDIANRLPMHLRLPPLKAFHAVLSRIPHAQARCLHPVLLQNVMRITEMPYFRKNRTHRQLVEDLKANGLALEQANFHPNESLAEAQTRCQTYDWQEAA